MIKQEIEQAVATLKKYHDLLLEVYSDYSVYSKADNYSDKSLELAFRANAVRNAVGTAITHMTQQLNNGWIPCSEKLPEDNGMYLVCHASGYIRVHGFDASWNLWNTDSKRMTEVIAWQPLPGPMEVSE